MTGVKSINSFEIDWDYWYHKRVKGYAPCPLDDCKVVWKKGMKP